jgi:hypothetical protein
LALVWRLLLFTGGDMTHTEAEALKLALEALTRYVNEDDICEGMPGNEPWVETKYMGEAAITAIKQALAAQSAVQEPVAWGYIDEYGEVQKFKNPAAHKSTAYDNFQLLYTTPPAAQPAPVPLTDEQIIDIRRKTTAKTHGEWADTKAFARAIEAAHGITKGQP